LKTAYLSIQVSFDTNVWWFKRNIYAYIDDNSFPVLLCFTSSNINCVLGYNHQKLNSNQCKILILHNNYSSITHFSWLNQWQPRAWIYFGNKFAINFWMEAIIYYPARHSMSQQVNHTFPLQQIFWRSRGNMQGQLQFLLSSSGVLQCSR
jgi:hypothetical protein